MLLRKAQMEDALKALEWRNDETTRMNSFNHEIITEDAHLAWFKRKLEDKTCQLYILEDDEEPSGSIRIDIDGEIGEISYMIAPGKRGRGYGPAILELLEKEASTAGIKTLVGFVDKNNKASARCFEKNGYTMLTAGDIYCFIKNI